MTQRKTVDRAIAHAIELAVMAEREACAHIAWDEGTKTDERAAWHLAQRIEDRIRDRDVKPARSLQSA